DRNVTEVQTCALPICETGGLMLQPALDAGFERFLVLSSRPRDYRRSEFTRPGLLTAVLRRYPAVAQATLARPALYNETKQRILEIGRASCRERRRSMQ